MNDIATEPDQTPRQRAAMDVRIKMVVVFPGAIDSNGRPAATINIGSPAGDSVQGVIAAQELIEAFSNWDGATSRAFVAANDAAHRRLIELREARAGSLALAHRLMAAAEYLLPGTGGTLPIPEEPAAPTETEALAALHEQVVCALTLDVGSAVETPGWQFRSTDREGYNQITTTKVNGGGAMRILQLLEAATPGMDRVCETAAAAASSAADDMVRWAGEYVNRACPPAPEADA